LWSKRPAAAPKGRRLAKAALPTLRIRHGSGVFTFLRSARPHDRILSDENTGPLLLAPTSSISKELAFRWRTGTSHFLNPEWGISNPPAPNPQSRTPCPGLFQSAISHHQFPSPESLIPNPVSRILVLPPLDSLFRPRLLPDAGKHRGVPAHRAAGEPVWEKTERAE